MTEADTDMIPQALQNEEADEGMEELASMNGHTIMLIQFSSNEETRTYIDCKSPYEAMETFCRIYENFLLNKQGIVNDKTDKADPAEGATSSIEYKLDDILRFAD